MAKRTGIVVGIILLLFSIFAYKYYVDAAAKAKKAAFSPPPVPVSAIKVVTTSWQDYLASVANLEAKEGVDLNTQVAGVVAQINFQSGQTVKKGDLLLALDASILDAKLKSAQANVKLKQVTFKRYDKIVQTGAVTDDQRDTARAEYQQAQADAQELQAQIDQMNIIAPFSGKIGIREVNTGQFIAAGTKVTSLQTVDPILADFSIPVKDIPKLKLQQTVEFYNDIDPSKAFSGTVTAIDSKVDEQTRSIQIQAELANKDGSLYPGMFGQIHVLLPKQNNVAVIPQAAITYTLYGDIVYVITSSQDSSGKTKLTVKQQMVTLGSRRGNDVAVLTGLKSGDEVVTSGQAKLHNGATVTINNEVGV